ncbi:hypothetical protein AB4865_07185 [Capnocytophaga sp. ARDL2]|uniref:hypothetical protein n=1 Tax=Capnocytophaga sp. ARDL2 TaxID=3238809 RepID=UPI003558E015
MTDEERESERLRLKSDLDYYLDNYNELTRVRPNYKKIVDKEINRLVKALKALSR